MRPYVLLRNIFKFTQSNIQPGANTIIKNVKQNPNKPLTKVQLQEILLQFEQAQKIKIAKAQKKAEQTEQLLINQIAKKSQSIHKKTSQQVTAKTAQIQNKLKRQQLFSHIKASNLLAYAMYGIIATPVFFLAKYLLEEWFLEKSIVNQFGNNQQIQYGFVIQNQVYHQMSDALDRILYTSSGVQNHAVYVSGFPGCGKSAALYKIVSQLRKQARKRSFSQNQQFKRLDIISTLQYSSIQVKQQNKRKWTPKQVLFINLKSNHQLYQKLQITLGGQQRRVLEQQIRSDQQKKIKDLKMMLKLIDKWNYVHRVNYRDVLLIIDDINKIEHSPEYQIILKAIGALLVNQVRVLCVSSSSQFVQVWNSAINNMTKYSHKVYIQPQKEDSKKQIIKKYAKNFNYDWINQALINFCIGNNLSLRTSVQVMKLLNNELQRKKNESGTQVEKSIKQFLQDFKKNQIKLTFQRICQCFGELELTDYQQQKQLKGKKKKRLLTIIKICQQIVKQYKKPIEHTVKFPTYPEIFERAYKQRYSSRATTIRKQFKTLVQNLQKNNIIIYCQPRNQINKLAFIQYIDELKKQIKRQKL